MRTAVIFTLGSCLVLAAPAAAQQGPTRAIVSLTGQLYRAPNNNSLDFEHALRGHALGGTKKDAGDSLRYLEDIARGVAAGIGANRSLRDIQKSLTLDAYEGFERRDTIREAHIAAVYATMKGTHTPAAAATR